MDDREQASLEDVLITPELARRPTRNPNYEAESRALAALAVAMAASPQAILQQLVETALELCRADSAGISILEPGGTAGMFRWHAIAGAFASHIGEGMPREASPCGVVLDRDRSLLFGYPERHFEYGMAINPPIVEALLVPFHVGGKPVGTLWAIAHTSSRQFDAEDQRLLTSLSRFAAAAHQMKTAALTAVRSKEEVRQILDTAATGITRCSRDLRYVSANPAYTRLAGLSVEQIIGRPIVDVMGTKAFEVIRPYVERVLRGERVEYEELVPFAAGGTRFLHVVDTPWVDDEGQVAGWVASVSDITNSTALHESEERLRLAMSSGNIGFWDWDVKSGRVTWSRELEDVYGWDHAGTYDAFSSRVHPDDLARVESDRDTAIRNRRPFDLEFRIILPSWEIRWLCSRGRGHYDENGRVVRVVGINIDISERKRLEESQRQNGDRQAFLLTLSDALRSAADPSAMQALACRMLGEHLQANRVTYEDIEGDEFIIHESWVKDVNPRIRRGPITVFGNTRIEAFRHGETISSDDVFADPRFSDSEQENFRAVEMRAFVSVGLRKSGQWVGTFGVHSRTPRVWTKAEIELIQEVAERSWSADERARADEALREREQRLRLALDASGAGSWTWDVLTNRVDWDDRFRELFGFTANEQPSVEAWPSRLHEEDRQRVMASFNEILYTKTKDRWDTTFRIVKPDGTVSWMESLGHAYRDAEGQVIRLSGVDLDVTQRRLVEETLQARRDEDRDRTMQLLLETAPQGILSTDARGVIMTANRALEKMFGWVRGELIGQSVEQLVPPSLQGQHAAHLAAYFREPQALLLSGMDLVGQRKDGSTFPIEISLNHVTTADGGHAIAFITDISARKQVEESLRLSHTMLSEKTAELERRTFQLSRLASQLTLAEQHAREQLARTLHDGLQQLLFSAGITLDRAVKSTPQADQVGFLQNARAKINEAMEAARTLSVDLFPPVLQTAGLPAALDWLAKRTQEQYGVVVDVTTDARANPEASDVRILLFEAVRELLFNAVKYAHADRVDINLALRSGDIIHIDVSDEGVGFDPDVTLHYKNEQQVGLGLFSIRERLALLGGHLDIQSAPGKGARFRLILPRTDLERRPTDDAEAPFQDARRGERLAYASTGDTSGRVRILVADDHVVARAGLRELFSERPALQVVGEAANGVEAISQATALQPDVIVMDVSMPEMNGIEATRQIHGTLPHIRIVALSTYDDEDTKRSMREAGAEAYFNKNEATDRLLEHLLSIRPRAKGSARS
jgi:PAS domain S-box-containing protein